MRQIVIVAAAMVLFVSPSPAYEVKKDMLTVEGGVVCISPFRLREGIAAVNQGDKKWTEELGCVRLRDGVRALRIRSDEGLLDPWQVRLMPEGYDAVTVWGYVNSFTTTGGKKLSPY